MLTYVASFAMSWGPIVWVLLSEIFPNKIRGKAMAIAVASQWIANYLVSWTFPIMDKSTLLNGMFNHAFPYWIYGAISALAVFFMIRFVPETKGKTLEEMEKVFIKSKYESSDIKFIITGSNSSMLSNDLNTLLSGRSLNIHLDTFSFNEFLNFKQINYSNEIEKISNKIAIKRAVEEYMNWGGFYEVFSIENENLKKEILLSYVKNIIYQDIIPRYGIRNSEIVERLFFYLLSNLKHDEQHLLEFQAFQLF